MPKHRYLFEDGGHSEFDKEVLKPLNQAVKDLKEILRYSRRMTEATRGDLYEHVTALQDQAAYRITKSLKMLKVLLLSTGNEQLLTRLSSVREALVGPRSTKATRRRDVHAENNVKSLVIEIADSIKSWPEKTSLQDLRKEGFLDTIKLFYEGRCFGYNTVLHSLHRLFPALKVKKHEIQPRLFLKIFD